MKLSRKTLVEYSRLRSCVAHFSTQFFTNQIRLPTFCGGYLMDLLLLVTGAEDELIYLGACNEISSVLVALTQKALE